MTSKYCSSVKVVGLIMGPLGSLYLTVPTFKEVFNMDPVG